MAGNANNCGGGDDDDDDDDDVYQQTDEESRYHHVAGLRDYHATVSPSRPDWWRLPSSNLETDQSSRQW